ncbi:MAG: phenylacetate--CoA ligase family protein [Deltaproteobacteria bacterium]|nr:phenylacetate--CoA ligase family protein [Deltaproteobacteria bacterium]
MTAYFHHEVETAPRETIRDLQLAKLNNLLKRVCATNPFYRRKFAEAGIGNVDMTSLEDLTRLPYAYKGEFQRDQAENPPYGTNLTEPLENYVRFHQTTGTTGRPLKWLDTREGWDWRGRCAAMSLTATGVTAADTIFFPFAFGPHVAFWGIWEGAFQIGALAIAGGGWDTLQRVKFIMENKVTVVACTPTYALRMAEEAEGAGINLGKSNVRITFHAGEPGALIPSFREKIKAAWNAMPFDYPGLTEAGAYGMHCTCQETSIHMNEEEFLLELIDPQTGVPLSGGGVGEMVLTNLGRVCSPAIRFRTGDIVNVKEGQCACGRTFLLLEGGVIGRSDEMITVRGMNIYPSQIGAVVAKYLGAGEEYQIVAYTRKGMADLKILLELSEGKPPAEIVELLKKDLRECLEIRVEAEVVPSGTLQRSEYKSKKFIDKREK